MSAYMSAYSAEEKMSELIEKSTREKKERVINGIYEHLRKTNRKDQIPYITHNVVKRVFRILSNYCKILHTGNVKKQIPASIFHSSNLALKNCSALKMQQKITDFFEENKSINLSNLSDIEILKMMITPAEYDTALEKFSMDKSSSSSSPRSPRSPQGTEEDENRLSDVDGGARIKSRKNRKSYKGRKSHKTHKTHRSKKQRKTAKRCH